MLTRLATLFVCCQVLCDQFMKESLQDRKTAEQEQSVRQRAMVSVLIVDDLLQHVESSLLSSQNWGISGNLEPGGKHSALFVSGACVRVILPEFSAQGMGWVHKTVTNRNV